MNWADLWEEHQGRLLDLFSSKQSFLSWCGRAFFPRVPSEVSLEEIVVARRKKLGLK